MNTKTIKKYIKKYSKKLPKKYLPNSLSLKDKYKQLKSIKNKKKRPKLKSFKSKRSGWVKKFENKYGFLITNKKKISINLLKMKGIDKILQKGRGAYYSSGSRPEQTPDSWAYARLASALLFGPAAKIDKDILLKYGKNNILHKARKLFKKN